MKTTCEKIPCDGCPQMLIEGATLMALFGLTIVAKVMPLIVQ
jgi:hypothetical protein